ncbi:MAG: hypothetical protein ACLVJH_08180 [Faecalibacterium prausnitzii]
MARKDAAFSDAVKLHSMVDDIQGGAPSLPPPTRDFQMRRADYSAHCMPFTKERACSTAKFLRSTTHDQSAPSWASGCPTKHGRAATSTTLCPRAGKLWIASGV